MSGRKTWIAKSNDVDKSLIEACDSDKVLAVLLNNRGINTSDKIKSFLNPLKIKHSSPDVFVDMQKAAERIRQAIENKEHITVYGDFDADGITSTALLFLTLKEIGADVDYYLPDRMTESHGLNTKALVNIISKHRTKLIITVDCGISNVKEVNFAKSLKTDIIITDHHEAPEILPEAYAIINPKAPNSIISTLEIDELQSLSYLAGVGVAFKLACKLLEIFNCKDFIHSLLPLVAIGTIGDVVELLDENRSLVEMGLELIKNSSHKGIQKLIDSIGFSDKTKITSENIAFGIVPRLNAAGRLESPQTAISILITQDDNELEENIKKLNDFNQLRQKLCDETFESAKEQYEKEKYINKKSIILLNDNWHIGIIGIVASKLAEKYNRPVFLMTRDANNPNIIRCSSRSISTINIHELLSQLKNIFEGFGGHKMAAGFSFDENKIKFDDFKKQLIKTIEENTQDSDFSEVKIYADMIVQPEDITIETIKRINKLQPFGSANPEPVFIMNDLIVQQSKKIGQNNNHLKITASKNNSESIDCIKWNEEEINLPDSSKFDILFTPQINEFNGNTTIQYIISDIHSDYIKEKENSSDIRILDHRNKKDILNQVLDFVNSTKRNTCIFIENKKIKKEIENCKKAVEYSFNIENIPHNKEQLMLFDCPKTQEDFKNIIYSSNANIIHLMNFDIQMLNTELILSTISGMLKYAITNLKGEFEIKRLIDAINLNEELIIKILNLFDEIEMIDLEQISDNTYKITHLYPLELSKIKQNELYKEIEEEIEQINNFRKFYLTATVDEIKSIL